jgi:prepilin-type processing-associated H-X9-DG protein
LEKLTPELSPSLIVSWADASGWHSRSREPFPGSSPQATSATVGIAATAVAVLLPSLSRARETADRVKCASNERQIGQACLLYANYHRGKYPDNIGQLLTEGDITAEVFLCPSSKTALPKDYKTMAPADLGKWLTDNGDYVFCGAGMTTSIGADQVVLYEKPADHTQGMNILFGDGHVEFDMMPAAAKMIHDQNKTVPGVELPDAAPGTALPDIAPPSQHVPTVDEAKADIERQLQAKLGRPLTDAEIGMIEVTQKNEQINVTLHEPLNGRLRDAIQAARGAAASGSSYAPSANTSSDQAPVSNGKLAPSAPAGTATAPSIGVR